MKADNESTARMFFAVLPDPATRTSFERAAAAVPCGPTGRAVPPGDYHATLAFVGPIPAARVDDLRDIGHRQRGTKFVVRFDAYEYWPKPEVVVAVARAIPSALEMLWVSLHAALAERRWALEPKRLRPHVTLVKKVAQEPARPVLQAFDWAVNDFVLMRSQPGALRSSYTVVDTWPLLDEVPKT